VSRFSDAALLKGNFAHMAAEFRAGERPAPKTKDWNKTAVDTPAEEAAQDVAKHIFALQQSIDEKNERIEVLAFSAVGEMKVLGLVPGEGDLIRVDGILPDGKPVAILIHASQLALTFIAVPLEEKPEEDGLAIGFLIFDELKKRKAKRAKKSKKLSLSTSRKMKLKPAVKPKKTSTKK